jgi:excisionase family DNA binding protein
VSNETNTTVALLLTPEQVADQLQVPVATLRRWVTEGKVPFHRIGRKTRFSQANVQAILELSQVQPERTVAAASPRRGRRGA